MTSNARRELPLRCTAVRESASPLADGQLDAAVRSLHATTLPQDSLALPSHGQHHAPEDVAAANQFVGSADLLKREGAVDRYAKFPLARQPIYRFDLVLWRSGCSDDGSDVASCAAYHPITARECSVSS